MSIRSTLFLAGAAVAAMAVPAAAHEGEHHQVIVESHEGTYDGDWEGHWQDDGQTWRGMWNGTYTTPDGRELEGRYVGTFIGQGRFISDDGQVLELDETDGWHAGEGRYEIHLQRRDPHAVSASPDGRLGYTLAEREAWLADCRLVMSSGGQHGYQDRGGNGGLVGGLVGAVAGGIAGNRIAGDGDRLVGTVIGAGVGGLAGAAIGSAVDGDGHHEPSADEIYAARYCDAYLRRYEMGGGTGFYGQGYAHPMMMVQMAGGPAHGYPGHRHTPQCTTMVREEWITVQGPAPHPAHSEAPYQPHPQPHVERESDGKITPIE